MPIRIATDVLAETDAVQLLELESVLVPAGVTLATIGGNGISGVGADHRILLYGQIQAAFSGIAISGSNRASITTGRDALIASDGDAIAIDGDRTTIVHRGTIDSAGGVGIALTSSDAEDVVSVDLPPQDPRFRISNYGEISGTIAVTTANRGGIVSNYGTLVGTSGTALSFGLVPYVTTSPVTSILANSGQIAGDVVFEGNATSFATVRNSGIIDGNLTFADGTVSISNRGTLDGNLRLGGTQGKVVNTGLITGDVTTLSSALDETTFDNSRGTVTGTISLGGGNDTYIAGENDGIVDGGTSSLNNSDILDFGRFTRGITYDDTSGAGVRPENVYKNFEIIYATKYDDVIFAPDTKIAIYAGGGNDTVYCGDTQTTVFGGNGADSIIGSSSADKIYGESGNDIIVGNGGGDVIRGGRGNDTITVLGSKNELYGGTGRDTFVFGIGPGFAPGDQKIVDFSGYMNDGDRINLSAWDANANTKANDAFTYIGKGAFSGVAGELIWLASGSDVLVRGDLDGDKDWDFTITLNGVASVSAVDFVL